MLNSRIYITTNTPSADDTIDIAVGTSAINGTEQTIADENTAPTGVSWSAPANYAAGIALGDIPPSQHRFVWYRRTLNSGAAAFDNDSLVFEVGCDSSQ